MRILIIGMSLISLLLPISTLAAETNQRDYSVSFGYGAGSLITFKKIFSEDNAFQYYAEAGFGATHAAYSSTAYGSTTSYSTNNQYYSASLGTRYFLSHEKFADFLFLALTQSYSKYSYSLITGYSSVKTTQATLGYGLEYFLDTHLSVEASAGIQFAYSKFDTATSNSTQRMQSFPGIRTAITYYW